MDRLWRFLRLYVDCIFIDWVRFVMFCDFGIISVLTQLTNTRPKENGSGTCKPNDPSFPAIAITSSQTIHIK